MTRHLLTLPLVAAAVLLAAGLLAPAVRAQGLTARVLPVDGVPRLIVNGKIMRPRIFWGGPGSSTIPIKAGEQSLSFEFSPMVSEPSTATLHFRFKHIQSKVVIHSVHLVDLTTGKDVIPATTFTDQATFDRDWAFWPANDRPGVTGSVGVVGPDASGTPGGVQLAQWPPAQGKEWSDKHIYHNPNLALDGSHKYRLEMTLRSDVATDAWFSFYKPDPVSYLPLGGVRDSFASQIELAKKSGVDIISFISTLPWPKPGEPLDSRRIDTTIGMILKVNPNALILPRLYIQPPDWWLDAHPGDEMKWLNPSERHRRNATPASLQFRADASAAFAAEIAHLEARFGDHIIGYHPAGQNTDEWFYVDSWGPDWNGYAEADQAGFRKWLTAKYGTDAVLRAAWHNPAATLASAVVPSPQERMAGDSELRDPATQQNVIDFTLFQQEDMAACVCSIAHTVRQATAGKKLSVFFYGYAHEFGGMQNGPGNAGHYGARFLLDSSDIDMIASPWSYDDRGLKGSGPIMTACDSYALAGKIYIAEDDTATALSQGNAPGSDVRVTTAEETNKILMRNSAEVALRNLSTWWMDLGRQGWFDDPEYWKALDKFWPVEKSQLDNPRPFRPEIATVVDEHSVPMLNWRNRVGYTISGNRMSLGRCGAPYGQYLQDDVLAGKVHAKVYVFDCSYQMDASQRARLVKATSGAAKVWCYLPGYYDGPNPSLDAVKQLTGFTVKLVTPGSLSVTPTPLGQSLGLKPFGSRGAGRPTLAVADASDQEALATYADGSVAVALRKTASGPSIFVGPSEVSIELIRIAAKAGGAHLYADNDATVFANGPFVCLHATKDGPVTLDTGKPGAVVDVISHRTLGQGPKVTIPMNAGDTLVLQD